MLRYLGFGHAVKAANHVLSAVQCAGPQRGFDPWDGSDTMGSHDAQIGHEIWILRYCRCGNAPGFLCFTNQERGGVAGLEQAGLGEE